MTPEKRKHIVIFYLNETISKVDAIPKISTSQVAVEGSRVKLSEHEDLVDATVNAITHRDVDHPIASTHRNLPKKILFEESEKKKKTFLLMSNKY